MLNQRLVDLDVQETSMNAIDIVKVMVLKVVIAMQPMLGCDAIVTKLLLL